MKIFQMITMFYTLCLMPLWCQVNTESIRGDHETPGLSQNMNLSFAYISGNSEIIFLVKEIIDLDIDIYNFENRITVHEKQGAHINANIIEDSESEMYGVLCYLEGNKIATSSQFFITDSTNYFVSGGLEFNTSINPEIEIQNNIMKQEILKFINSFKWSFIPK